MDNKTLVILSTKDPTELLCEQVRRVRQYLPDSHILVVDSDSTDRTAFAMLPADVEVCFIGNKGYEWGAYRFGYECYPNYARYVCLQDSLLLAGTPMQGHRYSYKGRSGFMSDPQSYSSARQLVSHDLGLLRMCAANRRLHFELFTHNSFVVDKKMMRAMFRGLPALPECKRDSQAMERVFGLWRKMRKFQTKDLASITWKVHGNRGDAIC